MARRAFVIHREKPEPGDVQLGRILTFFGVPWEALGLTDLADSERWAKEHGSYAVLGSAEALGAAAAVPHAAAVLKGAAAIYTHATENREASIKTLSMLAGREWVWSSPSGSGVSFVISALCPEFTGPMSGLQVDTKLIQDGEAVTPSEGARTTSLGDAQTDSDRFVPIVSVNGAYGFIRINYEGVPTYFCASTAIVDIDAPVGGNYYDVKTRFLSTVPLVMFITWAFRDVMWRSSELGACLIIDDPLLKRRYGLCDFSNLGELMRKHRFTTNIAFIPWNWRRTSSRSSDLFRRQPTGFSVSIHGCDHVAAEFGATSEEQLARSASTAWARMARHQSRTGIEHDPVMVFPQGIFSSRCPQVLKRHGFMAAVNTEVSPTDTVSATRIRDVWDLAILRYNAFPIYTRRYAFHGVENFAFDMLLGKPCFIVAHHDFFSDRGVRLIELLQQLELRRGFLQWRSPREVIRRAYRLRQVAAGVDEVRMYGNELLIANPLGEELQVRVCKEEVTPEIVEGVQIGERQVPWRADAGCVTFTAAIPPRSECVFTVTFKAPSSTGHRRNSIRYDVSVAARRLLSEFRDEYAQRLGVGLTK